MTTNEIISAIVGAIVGAGISIPITIKITKNISNKKIKNNFISVGGDVSGWDKINN